MLAGFAPLGRQLLSFARRPHIATILANATLLVTERVVRLLVSFVVMGFVARTLGPASFGLLSYALSFVALAAPIATLGLEAVTVRELIKRPESSARIVSTVLVMRFMASLGSMLFVYALARTFDPHGSVVAHLAIAASLILAFSSLEAMDYLFMARQRARPLAVARIVGSLAASALKIGLVYVEADLIYFALVHGVEALFMGACVSVAFKRTFGERIRLQFDLGEARRLLNDSWPLIASGLLVIVFMRLDQMMLAQLGTIEDVGRYAAAIRVVELWVFLPSIVLRSIYPHLVAVSADAQRFASILRRVFHAALWTTIALVAANMFLVRWAVPMLYGPEYAESIPIASVLLFCLLFMVSGEVRAQVLFIQNLKKYHFPSALLGIGVLVALNLLLIPLYGGVGAAIATLAGYAASAVGSSFLFAPIRWIGRLQLAAFSPRLPKLS